MTAVYFAHTVAANPPGATPVLSQEQLFKGFQRKIRRPYEFVPTIASAEVLDDKGDVVRRRVTFKAAEGRPASEGRVVVEVCTEHAPHRVDYALDDGSSVLNLISAGSSGRPDDLYVTYSFAWKLQDVEPGSAAYAAAVETSKAVAKHAVETSVATTRRLVADGVI